MAMGALCAAADEMGLRVPQDVSLIGYDGIAQRPLFYAGADHDPSAKDSLGETAFNMLLDRIVNKREEPQSIEVHPRLIERAPWLTARSATIVVNHPLRSLFRLPPLLIQRLTIAEILKQPVNAGDISFCCHVQTTCRIREGFSSFSATHFPSVSPRFGEMCWHHPMHNPAEIRVADDSQSGTTSLFWLSSNPG